MLLPCDEGMIETLRARITQSALHHGKGMGFLPAFGLFRIDDRSLPVGIMYDRALLALASVKGNYAQRFRWYDDGMLRENQGRPFAFARSAAGFGEGRDHVLRSAEMQPRHGQDRGPRGSGSLDAP